MLNFFSLNQPKVIVGLCISLCLSWTGAMAYIGQPSFRIEDDPEYQAYAQDYQRARWHSEKSDREYRQVYEQYQNVVAQLGQQQKILQDGQREQQELQQSLQQLQQDVPVLQGNLTQLQNSQPALAEQVQRAEQQTQQNQTKLNEAKTAFDQATQDCQTPKPECPKKVEDAKKDFEAAQNQLQRSQQKMQQSKQQLDELNASIKATSDQLQNKQKQMGHKQKRSQELQIVLANAQGQVTQLDQQTRELDQRAREQHREMERARHRFAEVDRSFREFSNSLNQQIDTYNQAGADQAQSDANTDGADAARTMGTEDGRQDGLADGKADGTRQGQDREYSTGRAKGRSQGTADGIRVGVEEGTRVGTKKALMDLGESEGKVAGIDRANRSDAKQVGAKQGAEAGHLRASKDGKILGGQQGQAEAVKKNEEKSLRKTSIQGNFAGTFARQSHSLSPQYTGRSYNPYGTTFGKDILRRAYADGYVATYPSAVVGIYNSQINAYYYPTYDQHYSSALNEALSLYYEESEKQGYNYGYKEVYQTEYEKAREAQTNKSYNETLKNPDRGQEDYTSTYAHYENKAYAERYESLRAAEYKVVEEQTYKNNIAARTSEAKAQRIAEVDAVYQSQPVVHFMSSAIKDVGVDKITPHDGYYQPKETILHDLVIKNYGGKSLVGATMLSQSGETTTLPDIPAQSEVTIVGAGISHIDSKVALNSNFKDVIQVKAPLTSNDRVQALHYEKPDQLLLKAAETHEVEVRYPIFVMDNQNPYNFGTLALNKVVPLALNFFNTSDVIYRNVDVELSSNGIKNIFITPFDQVPEINSGLDVNEARIQVTDMGEIGRTIEVRARIKYKSVILGELEKPITFKVVR